MVNGINAQKGAHVKKQAKVPKRPKFIVLDQQTKRDVARMLRQKLGYVLYVEPGHWSFDNAIQDICMDLFHKPIIRGDYLRSTRSEKWTGKEHDRHYWIHEKPKPLNDFIHEMARSFHQRLPFGQYEFNIRPQSIIARGWIPKKDGLALYIPKFNNLEVAFRHGLALMMEKLNAHAVRDNRTAFEIEPKHIEAMMTYLLEDLKSGKVMRHNAQAGMEADNLVYGEL